MKKILLISLLFSISFIGISQNKIFYFNESQFSDRVQIQKDCISKLGYSSSLIDDLASTISDTLFSIPLVADSTVNLTIAYGINATDGDTTQGESGVMLISAVNYNSTLQYSFTTLGSTQPTGMLGTLSKTLTCVLASNVLYAVVNVTSSIAPSTMKIRIIPNINSSYQITKSPY